MSPRANTRVKTCVHSFWQAECELIRVLKRRLNRCQGKNADRKATHWKADGVFTSNHHSTSMASYASTVLHGSGCTADNSTTCSANTASCTQYLLRYCWSCHSTCARRGDKRWSTVRYIRGRVPRGSRLSAFSLYSSSCRIPPNRRVRLSNSRLRKLEERRILQQSLEQPAQSLIDVVLQFASVDLFLAEPLHQQRRHSKSTSPSPRHRLPRPVQGELAGSLGLRLLHVGAMSHGRTQNVRVASWMTVPRGWQQLLTPVACISNSVSTHARNGELLQLIQRHRAYKHVGTNRPCATECEAPDGGHVGSRLRQK